MTAPAVRNVGAFVSSAGGANATVALATHQTGDIILLFCQNQVGGSSLTFNQNTAGFALLDYATSAGARGCYVYWVRATSSSMTNPSVTCSTNHQLLVSISISGCIATGNPWDVSASTDFTATSSWSWPAVTTTVADTLIVYAGGAVRDSTGGWLSAEANANLSSITERADDSISTNNGGGLAVWTGISASAQNIGSGTGTAAASYAGDVITVSMIPPAVAGGDTAGDFFQFF